MGFIKLEKYRYILTDAQNRKTEILSIYEPLSNYSSLPMYESEGGARFPVYEAITAAVGDFERASAGVTNGLDKTELHLAVLLCAKALLSRSRGFQVLELGCDDGVLSCALARLLMPFSPHNRLTCVTERMSVLPGWREKLAATGAADIVSVVAADARSLPLPRDTYDIVLINGAAHFDAPADIITRAVTLTGEGGLLISVASSQYLLSSCFQVLVEGCDEYCLSNASAVLSKTLTRADKIPAFRRTDEYALADAKRRISQAIAALKDTALRPADASPAQLDDAIRLAAGAEDEIAASFSRLASADIKYLANGLKESLISLRLCDEADRAHFAAQLRLRYDAVVLEMGRFGDW